MFLLFFKQFLRSKTCQLGLFMVLLLGIISIFIGKQFADDQKETSKQITLKQKHHIERNLELHKDDLGLLLYYLKFTLVNKQNPLAALSIGQRDVNPSVQNVSILTLEGQKYDANLVNPVRLLYGNLDFSFLLVCIFPLLIIAFTYNLLSEERENGTWKMIKIAPKSLLNFLLLKLSVRLVLVLLVMSLLSFTANWVLKIPFNTSFLLFYLTGVFYLLFWFALSFWVISLKFFSGFNALLLLSFWLLIVVLLPAFVNNTVTNLYPIPEAFTTMISQRNGYHQKWDENKKETMEKFYANYSQFEKYGFPSEDGFNWPWYYAMQHLGDEESRKESNAMMSKVLQREALSKQIAQFVPSMYSLLTFNDLAGTSLQNHIGFLLKTNSFHEDLRLFFYPKIFSNTDSRKIDWEQFEPSYYKEQDLNTSWVKIFAPLVIGILIFFGISVRILIPKGY